VLGRADAIVFTGGVGENDPVVRAAAVSTLRGFGVSIDHDRNHATRGPNTAVDISAADSTIRLLVVPTDEEHEIADQTLKLCETTGTT
jgi:acetate kinase